MKTFLLLMALCLPCTAAVKRTAPLQSPKAASVPKARTMLVGETTPPVVPMTVQMFSYEPGMRTHYVYAQQVANTSMTFEYAPTIAGPWRFMGEWTPYPITQWVGMAWEDPQQPTLFVRAIQGATAAAARVAKPVAARTSPAGVIKLPSSKTKPKRMI